MRTKIFGKMNISYPLIRTRTCAYQRVRNTSFSENFVVKRLETYKWNCFFYSNEFLKISQIFSLSIASTVFFLWNLSNDILVLSKLYCNKNFTNFVTTGLEIRRDFASSNYSDTRKEHLNESLHRLACNILSNNDSWVTYEKKIFFSQNIWFNL